MVQFPQRGQSILVTIVSTTHTTPFILFYCDQNILRQIMNSDKIVRTDFYNLYSVFKIRTSKIVVLGSFGLQIAFSVQKIGNKMSDVRNQDNNCEFPDFEYRRTDYKNLSAQFCLVTKNSSRIIVVVQKNSFLSKRESCTSSPSERGD